MARSDREYIYGLDVIRFLAAVSVAAFHLTWRVPYETWRWPYGWIGVQIFFVISGFVIANSAYGSTARKFVISRFLRLYPVAWCALPINAVAIAIAHPAAYVQLGIGVGLSIKDLIGSFVLFDRDHLASAYWTLVVELSFYAVVALALCFKRFNNVQIWGVILVLWSSPLMVRLVLRSLGHEPNYWAHGLGLNTVTLVHHGFYFGLGMLIWVVKERHISWVGLSAAALALVAAAGEIGDVVQGFNGFFLSCYGIFLASVIGICLSMRFNDRFPRSVALRGTIRLLGLATYPFYLLHEAVGGFVLVQMNRVSGAHLLNLVIALLVIGVISILIARYAEPALRRVLKGIGSGPRSLNLTRA
jgi:exopolysaccharide production protein ExoZ